MYGITINQRPSEWQEQDSISSKVVSRSHHARATADGFSAAMLYSFVYATPTTSPHSTSPHRIELAYSFFVALLSSLDSGQVAVTVVKRDFLIVVCWLFAYRQHQKQQQQQQQRTTTRRKQKPKLQSPTLPIPKPKPEAKTLATLALAVAAAHSVFGEILSRADVSAANRSAYIPKL